MQKTKCWVESNLIGKFSKNAKGFTFFNYVRKIGKKSGGNGILWANIFAVDFKQSIPHQHKLFGLIKALSKELLQAQIDILKPNFILFVGGDNLLWHAENIFQI